ncbi:MAG: agmatinase, partial [Lachnospiraceae bacterium]|nr:agmatinase [Lachnospiraceae bacterium]
MNNMNIETFLGCDKTFEQARIVLFGAPFDSTTSYRPGARFASRMMRAESYGLETYSPYQDLDLEDAAVFDGGDLELCFGDANRALDDITAYARRILENGKLPLMIGGEHLVTLGAVRAVAEKYPEVHVIHFDAHADLRDDYLGAKLSHATVLRRVWDIVGDGKIYQFGIRSGERAEFEWGRQHVTTRRFDFEGLEKVVESLRGVPVYFTLDLDVLDHIQIQCKIDRD